MNEIIKHLKNNNFIITSATAPSSICKSKDKVMIFTIEGPEPKEKIIISVPLFSEAAKEIMKTFF